MRGRRGRGAGRKTPVFGILERGARATLRAIIRGRFHPAAGIHSDGWVGYDGLVEVGFAKHHDTQVALEGVRIDGIESFWSFAKRRRARFNGPPAASAFLKETEFRFNHRSRDIYKVTLASLRKHPLGNRSGPDTFC